MGVSLEIWRQRIGCFQSREPPKCKVNVEVSWTQSPSSFSLGMGSYTFFSTLLSMCIGTFLLDDLTVCGDIETNPWPPTPELPADLLASLKNGTCSSVGGFANQLKIKHVLELISIKGEKKVSTWPEVVDWMTYFYPKHNFDDRKKWSTSINDNWSSIKKNQKLNKSYYKDAAVKQEMDEWVETTHELPPQKISAVKPVPSISPCSPSRFEMQVLKAQINQLEKSNEKLEKSNERLQQENSELKKQVHALKEHPPPPLYRTTEWTERNGSLGQNLLWTWTCRSIDWLGS